MQKKIGIEADLYMSAEGGIHNFFGVWENTNLVVVENNAGEESVALSPSFPVPERLVEEIKEKDFQALQVLIEENKKIENESKQEISKLNKKVLDLIEDYNAADKERNEYLNEINNLEESIDYLNQIINSNNDEINFLKNNIDELNQVIEDNNNKINSLNNEIESLKEDILFLEERAKSSESFIRKLFKNE